MELPEPLCPQTCDSTIAWIKRLFSDPLYDDVDIDEIVRLAAESEWASDVELLNFFRAISIELAKTACRSSDEETASIFDRSIYYGLSLWSPYFTLWERSFATKSELLYANISTSGWETELDPGVDELSLICLIPLATAYEHPLFEALRNNTLGLDGLSVAQEEFLGYVAAMLGPGYYDGTLPTEIVNIPSSKILGEILEDWTQYPDIWTPELIVGILESSFADQKIKELIATVLRGEEVNDPDRWEEHKENEWTDNEIKGALSLCGE